MEINKSVILDLLPLYLANELSPETRELIEKYLETDKELAMTINNQQESLKFNRENRQPVPEDIEMIAFRKSRMQMATIIIIAVIMMTALLGALYMAFMTPV